MSDCRQLIRNSRYFDADWYRRQYRDVDLLGADPLDHFLQYGRLLMRNPGPEFDTRFCLLTYGDLAMDPENPLAAFLRTPDHDRRPVNATQLHGRVALAKDHVARQRPYGAALTYCLTLTDLDLGQRRVMGQVLNDLARLAGQVEVLVHDASAQQDMGDRLASAFPAALRDGRLRLLDRRDGPDPVPSETLSDFRDGLGDGLASSLSPGDAVPVALSRALLDIGRDHPMGFVLHHLSADGTDGHRLTMPAWMIPKGPPDARFLPRLHGQADDLLGILRHHPAAPLLVRDGAATLFERSDPHRMAVRNRPLANPVRRVTGIVGAGAAMTDTAAAGFNAAVSVMAQMPPGTPRQEVLHMLNRCKIQLIETLPRDMILPLLFHRPTPPRPLHRGQIPLFCCVRNETVFLTRMIDHYRSLGIERFFVVDDGSDPPVAQAGLGADVEVFTPRVGEFRTSKTLWIEGLVRLVVPEGDWMLTVDADEFLTLPAPWRSVRQLADALDDAGRDFLAAVLVDMLPNPDRQTDPADADDFRAVFDHFLDHPGPPSPDYLQDGAVQWGFGDKAALSWRFDCRYHLFGTVDSLRKMPLFRHRADRHPNQGFHSFDHLDSSRIPGPEIWSGGPVVPLLHYKLCKLFDPSMRDAMLGRADAYHAQTSQNIRRSFGAETGDPTALLAGLRDRLHPAARIDRVTRAF